MKSNHEKDAREKVMFLKRTAPFQNWTQAAITKVKIIMINNFKIAQDASWKNFKIGEEICSQGGPLNDVFFLRKGECNVLANYELDGKKGKIKIGKYLQFDCFGQEAALNHGAKSKFTVVAGYKVNSILTCEDDC
jgi:signal-transduction protein with cAMP-binding, CBS, and nucleotidyltransferase domain